MLTDMLDGLMLSYVGVMYVSPPSVEISMSLPGAELTSDIVAGHSHLEMSISNGIEFCKTAL